MEIINGIKLKGWQIAREVNHQSHPTSCFCNNKLPIVYLQILYTGDSHLADGCRFLQTLSNRSVADSNIAIRAAYLQIEALFPYDFSFFPFLFSYERRSN